jgi:tetratricopeptide (TPR) repeat protein
MFPAMGTAGIDLRTATSPTGGSVSMPRDQVYKYTPGQASTEELEATFVGRERLLEQLLARLCEWAHGAPAEHTLLVGPRGMGKTHLLRLLGHRVEQEQLAATVHVLAFPEESYAIGSADDLLRDMWVRLGLGGIAPTGAWVIDQLRDLHRKDGSRFAVLLDGVDLLLDQLKESDEGRLHQLMTTESHLFFVATAAQMPAALTEYDRPLFHLLRPEPLRPLDASQAAELLYARAKWADNTRFAETSKELGARISALSELAGGNPRLLLMLYQSLQPGELPSVIESIRALLDELTPFFKHVVESRGPQQRKLLRLAAFHDRGAAPSELAKESGLPERQVSALLGPLVKDGLLKRVRRPGARTSAYPFAEPLVRMWLQMRASPEGERRLACIVEFFRLWYEGAEAEYRQAFADQLRAASDLLERGRTEDWREVMAGLRYLVSGAPREDLASETVLSLLDFLDAHQGLGSVDFTYALATIVDSLDRFLDLEPDQPRFLELRGSCRVLVGDSGGLADLDRAVDLLPDEPNVRIARGRSLLALGHAEAAASDFTRALESDADSRDALYERALASRRIGSEAQALIDLDRVLVMHPEDSEASEERAWVLVKLGRWGEADGEFGRAEKLEPGNQDLPLLRILAKIGAGHHAEALGALGGLAEPPTADAHFFRLRGAALTGLGQPEKALKDFDRASALEPNGPSLTNVRGLALLSLRRNSDALAEFVRAVELDPESDEARFNHGLAMAGLGQREAAIEDLEASTMRLPSGSVVMPQLAASRIAELAANSATAGDPGQAKRALSVLSVLVKKVFGQVRGDAAFDALKILFRSGDQLLCGEALDELEPLFEDPDIAAPFRRTLVYIAGGRDPYFLESLNPDLRRAVELIATDFGIAASA